MAYTVPQVSVSRKWRDMAVVLRYVPDDFEAFTHDASTNDAVTVLARHRELNKTTTSGTTRQGAADLPGADALYVGMTYLIEVSDGDNVSARTTEVTVGAGRSALIVELPVGPAAGRVQLRVRDTMAASGYPLEGLPFVPVRFAVHPVPRTGREKVRGVTNAAGHFTLTKGAQLYVGRTYTVEVAPEDNHYLVDAAKTEFTVQRGSQTVFVDTQRSVGDVRAVFATCHANSTHWAAPLKLPAPFEYRVTHQRLGVVAYQGEVSRQPSHTVRQQIPGRHTLFVGETYTLEVGYQMRDLLKTVDAALGELTGDHASFHFNGAGDATLPSIEHAWSVAYHGDAGKAQQNGLILDQVAALSRAHPSVCLEVHCETGSTEWAAQPLADYYKLRRTEDVQLLMDHLARNRANACVDALVARGVPAERLVASFRGRTGRVATLFRAKPPKNSQLGDPRSGLAHLRAQFTVAAPQLHGSVQEVGMLLRKATGDVRLLFRSSHPDTQHWSHFLTVPAGLRLAIKHTALERVVSEGVVAGDDDSCVLVGSEPSRELYCLEHYTLDVEAGRYFEQDPNALLLQPGPQDVVMRVTWATRMVRCYLASADAGSWRQMQAKEAYARISAFLATHTIDFNGAGEAHLPRVAQAWSVSHTDEAKRRSNRETIAGVAAILREYPTLRVEVHGETGAATSAPRQLADHLGKHYMHDVGAIMDHLARERAQACLEALVAQGVPETQLFVTATGRGGALQVDFIPEGETRGQAERSAAEAEMARLKDEMTPLPAGVPYELRLKRGGTVIMAGMTAASEPEVFCRLPHKERLVVGQTYVFEAFSGPGTEPNSCEFTVRDRDARTTPPRQPTHT